MKSTVPRDLPRVIRLHPSAVERRRARQEVDALLHDAVEDLRAAGDDLGRVHGAFLSLARAVRLTMAHGLDVDQEVAS